jgi:hypothetical protein
MADRKISLLDSLDQIPHIDTVTATLLFLMSRRGAEDDAEVSKAIVNHLEWY